MKLTLQIQVLPTPEQSTILLSTMERFNEAATFAAKLGFDADKRSQPGIHKLAYQEIRERFGLTAQMAVRAIGKAVEVLRALHAKGETACPEFKPRGAITYDERILRFKGTEAVNLWTLAGRLTLPIVFGEYQGQRFGRIKGQCDLVYRGDKFFLYATIDVPEDAPIKVKDFLGVDMGVVNLATDSDGENYSGAGVDKVREKAKKHRADLNRKGTKSARRRLSKVRKRESNFRKNENHVIAKEIVAKAKTQGLGIAVEELAGITDRTTVRHDQRSRMKGWGFLQLRTFLTYKATLAGIPVVAVDPRNTSRTCPKCGHVAKGNRKNRNDFVCLQCEFSLPADYVGAINIKSRATVNWPNVGRDDSGVEPGRA